MMRVEHGTLDALTRPRFKASAKRAIAVCHELGTLPVSPVSPVAPAVPVV